MAITHVTFCNALEGGKQTIAAQPAAVETITANGATTISAKPNQVCVISTDTAAYVAFGASPTAAADAGHFLPAGSTRDFGFLSDGWIVDVTYA